MISRAILQTLKYSDHFSFPLTLKEIHLRLIGVRVEKTFTVAQILKKMIQKKQIEKSGNYYHLTGKESLVARRLARRQSSTHQLAHAKQLALQLGQISGVLAIYLTGSLAMSNSQGNSDIDLMIITEDHKLWTTRLILTIYTELLGLRRRPHATHSAGKLCLNLYLSPLSYLLPRSRRSLYTAYELIQAVPLYDPHHTRSALLSANSWISDFIPNATKGLDIARNVQLVSSKAKRSNHKGLMDLIEFVAYRLQIYYMKSKMTREYITPHSAFFHPRDPGRPVLRRLRLLK